MKRLSCKLLLSSDVARELAVSAQRVRQLERAGELVAVARTVRGVRLFTIESVRLLAAQRAVRWRARSEAAR